uniref:Secreted protein n=1 Tax=Panagrellus redivivus TaxID=6233 RepID=A0A7E4VH35_PANRE
MQRVNPPGLRVEPNSEEKGSRQWPHRPLGCVWPWARTCNANMGDTNRASHLRKKTLLFVASISPLAALCHAPYTDKGNGRFAVWRQLLSIRVEASKTARRGDNAIACWRQLTTTRCDKPPNNGPEKRRHRREEEDIIQRRKHVKINVNKMT